MECGRTPLRPPLVSETESVLKPCARWHRPTRSLSVLARPEDACRDTGREDVTRLRPEGARWDAQERPNPPRKVLKPAHDQTPGGARRRPEGAGEAGAGEAGADNEEAAGDGEGISVSDGRLRLIFLDRVA